MKVVLRPPVILIPLFVLSAGFRLAAKPDLEKEITFIRHGFSLGNLIGRNPARYLLETANFTGRAVNAWKDGRLSAAGKRQVFEKVMNSYDNSLVDRIVMADAVLVSPLVRALETCIIVLATAVKRRGLDPKVLEGKEFKVMADLREKLATDSDRSAAGDEDVPGYLMQIAMEQGNFKALAVRLSESYIVERTRTNHWLPHPENGDQFLGSIQRFRTDLRQMKAKRILIVGHNGWSRWTFAAGMPGPCHEPENIWSNVAFGGRQVRKIDNMGVVFAKFAEGHFFDVKMLSAKNEDHMTCTKTTNFALFSDFVEAKESGRLPADVVMHRMLVNKKQEFKGLKQRLITFSASGGRSFMAWGDQFADPLKYIDLTAQDNRLLYSCDDELMKVLIGSASPQVPIINKKGESSTVEPFYLQALNSEDQNADFRRLCTLLQIHIKFGSDTEFIAKVFAEAEAQDIEMGAALSGALPGLQQRWDKLHPDVSCGNEVRDETALRSLRIATRATSSILPHMVVPHIGPRLW